MKHLNNGSIKLVSLVLLLLLGTMIFASFVSSEEDKQYYFDQQNTLAKIDPCEGPMRIRINPRYKMSDDELSFIGCEKQSNYAWECECVSGKDINFIVSSNYSNIYNFNIVYYIEYFEIPEGVAGDGLSDLEMKLENNVRHLDIKKVVLGVPDDGFSFKLNITYSSIILATLIVIIGIGVYFLRKYKEGLSSGDQYSKGPKDVMSYSTKDDDEEFKRLIEEKQKEFDENKNNKV